MIKKYEEKFQKQEELNEELFAKIRNIISTLERDPSELEGKYYILYILYLLILI